MSPHSVPSLLPSTDAIIGSSTAVLMGLWVCLLLCYFHTCSFHLQKKRLKCVSFITFSIAVICKGALVSSVSLLNIFLNIFLEMHTLYFLLYLIYILSPKSPIFHSQLCLFVCFFVINSPLVLICAACILIGGRLSTES